MSVTPNKDLKPNEVFEYTGSNADVIVWLISRISGQPITEFIREIYGLKLELNMMH